MIADLGAHMGTSFIRNEEEFRFALNCECNFVRSQFQVAVLSDKAKGRRLTGVEVADAFGVDFLKIVLDEGSASIGKQRNSVGNTIKSRRDQLGLSVSSLSQSSTVSSSDIDRLEAGSGQLPIRDIEKICVFLGLDERRVGAFNDTGISSPKIRLRYFSDSRGDEHSFTEMLVAQIVPTIWKSARYRAIKALNVFNKPVDIDSYDEGWRVFLDEVKANDYSYPTVSRGEKLAQLAREVLGVGDTAPISNLEDLIKQNIGVFVSYVFWPDEYAGATISEGNLRSIAINNRGMNRWINTFRFTLAHELGHILFDQDAYLNDLKVDDHTRHYAERRIKDLPEMRANSFAAEFLLPKKAIALVLSEEGHRSDSLKFSMERLQTEYGVSLPAVRYRLKSFGIENADQIAAESLNSPTGQRLASDEFFDVVGEAYRSGFIHEDTFLSLTSEKMTVPVQQQLL